MYVMIILLVFLFILLLFVPFSFRKKILLFYIPALIAVFITFGMIMYPKEAFEASLNGLAVWWHIVFPALLPFFIFAQVLIGLGVVHFLGVLLEPVMRPVFNVPGEGSFVMAMGLASGFPLGAVLTSKLRQKKMCSKTEAERLLSFVNTADPLFMFGAVAVGMLHAPQTGIIIAIAHYLSAISVGLVMRFYRADYDKRESIYIKKRPTRSLFGQALNSLVHARKEDGRPFGQILGDSVRESINTLMLIGGFIMLFSVIITMMQKVSIAGFFTGIIIYFLELVNMDKALAPAFISGLLEIDLGCQLAGLLKNVSMEQKIIAVSAIIAFSGLSVHAQVASIISSTDMSIVPYSLARILHAFLAALYAMLLLGPLNVILAISQPVMPVLMYTTSPGSTVYWFEKFFYSGTCFLFLLGCLFVLSIIIASYRSGELSRHKYRAK